MYILILLLSLRRFTLMKPDDLLINLIKKLPTINPRYKHPNEKSINPTYCDIEHCAPLCPYDKKIWVLRGDLILAVGNKNAYTDMGNTPILNSVNESVQHYIDRADRYGHPSLAMPDGNYTGDAYYAGWLYQHTNHIKVYLCSGRYQNDKINQLEQRYLELYISMQFMEAFGEQDIVFLEYDNDYEMELFLRGKPFPANTVQRTYSPSMIKHENVLDLAIKYHDTQTAMQLLEAGAKPNKCAKDFIETGDLVSTQLLINSDDSLYLEDKLVNNVPEIPPTASVDSSSQEQLPLNDNSDSSTVSYFYQLTSMISSSGSLIFNSLFTDKKHSRADDAPINEEDRDPKRRKNK